MNKKTLIKLINNELNILQDIINDFNHSENIHPLEIELSTSKITDIYNMLLMLKSDNTNITLQQIEQTNIIDNINTFDSNTTELENKPKESADKHNENINDSCNNIIIKEQTKTITPELNNIETPIIEIPTLTENISEPIIITNETEPNNTKEETKPSYEEKEEKHILADKFQNKNISVNDTLASFKKNENIANLLINKPITNLKTAVNINDRIWYIKELFNNNNELYNKTLDELNALPDLNSALEYLFRNFTWNQNEKSTVSFLELIYRRFTN